MTDETGEKEERIEAETTKILTAMGVLSAARCVQML
jgi:hypothetical protein